MNAAFARSDVIVLAVHTAINLHNQLFQLTRMHVLPNQFSNKAIVVIDYDRNQLGTCITFASKGSDETLVLTFQFVQMTTGSGKAPICCFCRRVHLHNELELYSRYCPKYVCKSVGTHCQIRVY